MTAFISNPERVENALKEIIDLFKNPENLTKTVESVLIDDPNPNKPLSKWTLRNKIIAHMHGHTDARGYNQWLDVKRNVKKGQKAFYILAPNMITCCPKCSDPGLKNNNWLNKVRIFENKCAKCYTIFDKKDMVSVCVGFIGVPVFGLSQTEGQELPKYKPKKIPELMNVAKAFGLDVSYSLDNSFRSYGYFVKQDKKINLSTEDPSVFFHELTHYADSEANNKDYKITKSQDPIKESVAELGSAVLCKMFGIEHDRSAYDYISHYSKKDVVKSCMKVLERTTKAINFILDKKAEIEVKK